MQNLVVSQRKGGSETSDVDFVQLALEMEKIGVRFICLYRCRSRMERWQVPTLLITKS